MSLINQMLKDLESRRNPHLPGGGALPAMGSAKVRASRPLLLLLAVIIALLALSLAYLLWERLQGNPAEPQRGVAIAAPAAPAPAAEAAPHLVTPQPVAKPVPPRQKAVEPPSVPAPVAHLERIAPEKVVGSDRPQRLLLKGSHFAAEERVMVRWPGGEKLLEAGQVEFLDSERMAVTLTTGTEGGRWQVSLQGADGTQSGAVAFIVEPPPAPRQQPRMAQIAEAEEPAMESHMEKRIRPFSTMERAEQQYRAGYQALQQGRRGEAEGAWTQALAVEPRHVAAREGLVGLLLSAGRNVEAIRILADGVVLYPENGRLALLYARLQTEQGEVAKAIATLERAATAATQEGDLYATLAALYQRERRYGESIAAYRRAIRLEPQQGTWWMGVAISLEGDGQPREALSAYEEAQKRGNLTAAARRYVEQRIEALR